MRAPFTPQNDTFSDADNQNAITHQSRTTLVPQTGQNEDRKTGVAEWAPHKYNVGCGCANGCVYCYARGCALHYKRAKTAAEWAKEKLKPAMPPVRKREGTVMFPSAHDITPYYLPAVLRQLKALLKVGNSVLIVSKPRFDCISALCNALAQYKSQIIFRFTIGTFHRKITRLWEPGAPTPAERLICLKHAKKLGFHTSVSMEPMLAGVEDAVATFEKVVPHVTEIIWIGRMNHVNRWGPVSPEVVIACHYIRLLQSDSAILELVRRLGKHPQVRWKDSIREVILNKGKRNFVVRLSA